MVRRITRVASRKWGEVQERYGASRRIDLNDDALM
jgi:hypothetical protein